MNPRNDDPTIKIYGQDIDRALKLLHKKVVNGGYMRTLKERALYPAPSERKRQRDQKAKARRNWKLRKKKT